MKLIISTLIVISCLPAFGQNIELFGGLNANNFYDLENEGHYQSSYNSGSGYSFGLTIDNISADCMTLRLSLKFDKYSGNLTASDGGLGGGYTTTAEIDKSLISLGVFPLSFRIVKRIDLNIGFEISKLISESYKGKINYWLMGGPNFRYDLQERYNKYSNPINFGLSARLGYNLQINESIAISPQYTFYFGLSNEFIEFPKATKSIRHFIGLGIKKRLKST
ncbi:MAG: hypothetical protein CSA36_03940 [Draconibacterium sp.]|nr:MAG: hypothetical protein CSA36_03940 [Draconibacterium sp.]